ncbi:alcohol dehydrogenase [Thioclava dalianensis]|uniref:Alcohol dehydrogenase n=1 Tax=Thioclava dalianensis TaxID=1185766 RepID=A0A074T7P1_9RHOB|nr:cytochrome c [Thioclava dalianensis]KEP67786.1 alcohol dehydrogenase [Thioclava dalianensis]SFN91490.1 Cytochrome c, mono-and diheme variants [Thioclava dalianensis]
MKKLLLTLVAIIAVIGVWTAWYVTRTPSSPFDDEMASASPSQDLISRGKYVARAADCVACHSLPEGQPFAGGLKMGTPVGAIYATNITPDKKTGIGEYTLADFDRSIRKGVAADGHRLYPAMPYPSYSKMSDDDVKALYAYFMHGVQPVDRPNQTSEIPAPLNMRWPLALWNLAFAPDTPYQQVADHDAQWNRGAFLVQGPGHCGSCHTPRGLAFNEKGMDQSSKTYLSGGLLDGWYAPSLRQDPNTGLGRWSAEDIYAFLKNGRNEHGVVFGSMAEAYNNSTQFLTDDDLHAMAAYLKSLPGDPSRDGTPWSYDASTVAALAPAKRASDPGAQLYAAKCSFCHGEDGKGQGQWMPPLAGSSSSLVPSPASQINVVLNGSARVVSNGMPDSYRMPPYRAQLSDKEIAQVLDFVRSAWGNDGGKVAAKDVADLRKRTDPASSNVIVLQMR